MPPFVLLSLSSLAFVYHLVLSCWCVTPSLPPVSSSSHRNNKSGETPPPPSPIFIPRETSRLRGAYNTAALPPPLGSRLSSFSDRRLTLHISSDLFSSRDTYTHIHTKPSKWYFLALPLLRSLPAPRGPCSALLPAAEPSTPAHRDIRHDMCSVVLVESGRRRGTTTAATAARQAWDGHRVRTLMGDGC